MGEGTNAKPPEANLDEVGKRVEGARTRLDHLVSELDQRRHVFANAKRTVHDNPLWALTAAAVGVGIVGGAVALIVRRQQERQELMSRAYRLRRALGRMVDRPDRVAPAGSTIPGKLLTAAGTAVTTVLVKRLVESVLKPPAKEGSPAA